MLGDHLGCAYNRLVYLTTLRHLVLAACADRRFTDEQESIQSERGDRKQQNKGNGPSRETTMQACHSLPFARIRVTGHVLA